ncbi:MAG: hypothetical protein QM726_07385 [Chitinophagaceae bacterium]
MKKLIVALVFIFIAAVLAVYLFIPQKLTVEESMTFFCVPAATFRNLSEGSSWGKWWPGDVVSGKTKDSANDYYYSNNQYTLSQKNINVLQVLIGNKKETLTSEIHVLAIPNDSTLVKWQFNMDAGSNPFSRFLQYRKAVALKKSMHTILKSIQTYLSDIKNVYGVKFYEAAVTDTILITTKSYTAESPSVDYVYSRIDKLKQFCSKEGCKIVGTPMLNITPQHPAGYNVMLALPVDRFIPAKDSVFPVRLVGDKFVIADVTGGLKTVAYIHQQMRYYFQDYGKILMAVPFDYLITDRQKETDTTKWKTKIFSPLFHN